MLNAESQGKFLTELYVSTHASQEMILESASLRMSRLLIEQVDVTDAVEKNKKQKADFLKLIKFFENEGAAQLSIELTKLVKAIPDPSKLYSAAYGQDEDKVKTLSKDFSDKLMKANLAVSSTINAFTELKKALTPFFEDLDEDSRSLTIGELCKSKDPNQNFIPEDKLTSGMKKAFIPQKTFKDAFAKGAKAASSGSDGNSKLGKLFSTAFKFLGGFFAKPPVDSLPKLFIAFKEFVFASSLNAFFELADKLSLEGKKLTVNAGKVAGEASAEAAALAGGAKPEGGKAGDEEKKKASSAELQKALGDDEKAKSFIVALKNNDSTKSLFEEGFRRLRNKRSLSSIFFEAVSYDDLLKIAQGTQGVEKDDAPALAAKAAKFLKSQGADVDDSGVPAEDAQPIADDEKTAVTDAQKVASEVSSEVDSISIGKLIKKNVIGTIQPFVDRKSLSKKDRESLQKSVADLEDRLRTTSQDEAKPIAVEFGRTLKNWYDSLDPKIQAKLGGAKGSEKVLNGITKNVTDNIEKSFKLESKNSKEDLIIERWQRLAGIK